MKTYKKLTIIIIIHCPRCTGWWRWWLRFWGFSFSACLLSASCNALVIHHMKSIIESFIDYVCQLMIWVKKSLILWYFNEFSCHQHELLQLMETPLCLYILLLFIRLISCLDKSVLFLLLFLCFHLSFPSSPLYFSMYLSSFLPTIFAHYVFAVLTLKPTLEDLLCNYGVNMVESHSVQLFLLPGLDLHHNSEVH